MKRSSPKPQQPAPDQTCQLQHRDFCTGRDLRFVAMRVYRGNGSFTFDGAKKWMCKGCRELMNGAFKYA